MATKRSLSTRPRPPQLSTSTLSPEEQVRLLRGLALLKDGQLDLEELARMTALGGR